MFRNIKKLYRIVRIAIGRKRLNVILVAVGIGCLYMGYQNHFDIPKTVNDIIRLAALWGNNASLPGH